MKKLSLILMALLAMTTLFTQCKKTDIPSTDEGPCITLTAGHGQNNGKTGYTPITGTFVWTDGVTEHVYVGGSNHNDCLGILTGTGNGTQTITFSGNLTTTPNDNETLYFFYLGKDKTDNAVTTLDISNQDGTLDNLTNYHVAISDGIPYTGQTSFTATLNMKLAIAVLNLNEFTHADNTAETVYLHGSDIYATATVDYKTGTITGATKGFVNCGPASDEKYVALIPSTTSQTTLNFDSNSKTGSITFLRGIVAEKLYAKIENENIVALPVTVTTPIEGTTPGYFSVAGTDGVVTKMVRFSKGNLKAVTTDGWGTFKWYFMDHQYDMVELSNSDIASEYSGKSNVSLFGWGTSGYNHGATCYKPFNTNTGGRNYKAYNSAYTNLYDGSGQADWGYNKVQNSVDEENKWRTLKKTEFEYLFQTRANAAEKWGYATVDDVHGVIVLPDSFTDPLKNNGSSTFDGGTTGWDANKYSEDQWNNYMEPAGAVFLPAAGQRCGGLLNQTYGGTQIKPGDYGFYCTSDKEGGSTMSSNNAYVVKFVNNELSFPLQNKAYGHSVRLVLKEE